MHHNLKISPNYFDAVVSGAKTFEIRNTEDRQFKVGDNVWLNEWDSSAYTNRRQLIKVTYITDFMQMPGYVVFAFVKVDDPRNVDDPPNASHQGPASAGPTA